ncbi:hypothetical protein JOD63_001218 [Microbacterium terrae]|uniref:Uncharacterized protein n=1 Tax=Microbacterium terrae TaxID=69369 RepID=A0A0M2HJN7_9MICO|nr:hypothetical protein [Microbacterium terrae]KJL45053.1 hypothetical protein RS81_00363 [Microbacterium terrae]MBP1077250.1 hypothetical protein [Microbacterium terrae]GLJ99843.1 hypothetical protein GCM10017594_30410 [Microbacterium terrae]
MSTPEHHAPAPLTRKQMRDIRNTGATPVITADAPSAAPVESESGAMTAASAAPAPVATIPPPAPLARPAAPVELAPPPGADSAVDLGVSPLTRRQARQQERIRTASVPVITPEVAAAHAALHPPVIAAMPVAPDAAAPAVAAEPQPAAPSTDSGVHALFGLAGSADQGERAAEPVPVIAPMPTWQAAEPAVRDEAEASPFSPAAKDAEPEAAPADDSRSVSPAIGASLLGGTPADVSVPPSFDQLLTHSSSGTASAPNALIMSQAPEVSAMVAPVTATGDVLITGSFNLPEGLGSTGHAAGTADGKEVDAVLVDGELPAHSSPTPIAASAAVSTVKAAGEVIQPPAPEKGSRLMMVLAITAGVLALALVGVLILAFATGVL